MKSTMKKAIVQNVLNKGKYKNTTRTEGEYFKIGRMKSSLIS